MPEKDARESSDGIGTPHARNLDRTLEAEQRLCGFALGCRVPAEWIVGQSARCDLHRAMLDAEPMREEIAHRHGLEWKRIDTRAVTVAAIVVLFLLAPGCSGSPQPSDWTTPLFVFAAFVLGIALALLSIRITERCSKGCGCDPMDGIGGDL
jgi:hypothetical protein